MCVYLAPRWRRRSLVLLALAFALAVMAVDARTTDCGSGSEAVGGVQVGQVTTNATQSSTTVKTTVWRAGSTNDDSQSDAKTVSFKSLVQTTTAPSNGSTSSASPTTDNEVLTPYVVSSSDGDSQAKETQQVDDDEGRSFDFDVEDSSNSTDADSTSTSKSGDKTTGKTGTTNKATTPAPTPTQTAKTTSAPTPASTPVPTPTPTSASKKEHQGPPRPGTFDARQKGWSASGSNQQSVSGQSYEQSGSTTSAETLENQTKSAAAAATSGRSLDETLVVVIVGVVGAIGALLMFVSRKVLKETGDLEDSSIF